MSYNYSKFICKYIESDADILFVSLGLKGHTYLATFV